MTPICREVEDWLADNFPGSTIEDGYYFVRIKAEVECQVLLPESQAMSDYLTRGRCWIISVGGDLTPFTNPTRVEQDMTIYNPDYNIWEEIPRWIAETENVSLDIQGLIRSMMSEGILAIVAIDLGLVFNFSLLRLYATSKDELDRLGFRYISP